MVAQIGTMRHMAFHRTEIPDWATREREADIEWIRGNLHVFWPAAELAFEQFGRGALIVNTNTVVQHSEQQGNPIFYLPAEQIRAYGWLPAIQMVREYEPRWEFVAVLLKWQRESAYRVGVPGAKNNRLLAFSSFDAPGVRSTVTLEWNSA